MTELEVHKGLLGAAHMGARAMVVSRKLSKKARKECLKSALGHKYLDHFNGVYDEQAQLMLQDHRERVQTFMEENECAGQFKVRAAQRPSNRAGESMGARFPSPSNAPREWKWECDGGVLEATKAGAGGGVVTQPVTSSRTGGHTHRSRRPPTRT